MTVCPRLRGNYRNYKLQLRPLSLFRSSALCCRQGRHNEASKKTARKSIMWRDDTLANVKVEAGQMEWRAGDETRQRPMKPGICIKDSRVQFDIRLRMLETIEGECVQSNSENARQNES